jgi:ketosteroid isomerase-like protein
MEPLADSRRAIVEDAYRLFSAGDLSGTVSRFDPSIVLVIDEQIPDGGTYVGEAGVREYMSRFLEPWESVTMVADAVEPVGDTLLVRVAQRGTGRGSLVPIDMLLFHLWTFRGDMVIRLEAVLDEERARRIAGA